MHAPLPERIDVERAVATGRVYAGSVPLSAMPRLTSLLADDRGEVRYQLQFGRNAIHQKMVEMHAETALPLICQASLERFELPVQVQVRLGFVRDEADEAGLPEGYEAALTDEGFVDPLALIEALGYVQFYLLTTLAALPGIVLFAWLVRRGYVRE